MITIYWGINPWQVPEGLRIDPPVPIMNKFFKDRITEDVGKELNYNKCPALINELTNVYGIKPIYDYVIQLEGTVLKSRLIGMADESPDIFFKKKVAIRSIKGKLFSFAQAVTFFTDSPSLIMSQLPAFMEDNNIVKNTICIPGQFDIGKYFRGLDFAWHFREGCNSIEFNRKEISYYLKFHTEEKIKFQRFIFTPELARFSEMVSAIKNNKKADTLSNFKSKALDYYYNIFDRSNFKNKMLKIIKENLCKEEDFEGNVV